MGLNLYVKGKQAFSKASSGSNSASSQLRNVINSASRIRPHILGNSLTYITFYKLLFYFPEKPLFTVKDDLYKRKAFEMRYFCYKAVDRINTGISLTELKKDTSPSRIAKTSLSASNKTPPSTLPLQALNTNLKVIKKTKLDNYINFCSAENIYKINLERKFKFKPSIYKKCMNANIIRPKSSLCPLKLTNKSKDRKIKSVIVNSTNS